MALEMVGGAFLSSSLQFLFERIGSEEVLAYLRGKSKRCNISDLVGKLKIVLNSVLAVIEDAEQKKTRNKRVEEWLDELQEAVLDAEDLLDCIGTEAQQLKHKAESCTYHQSKRSKQLEWKKLHNCFSRACSFNEGGVERKLKTLLKRLEFIASQRDLLSLEKCERKNLSWRLHSTSLVDESEVYGRDYEKGEMVNLLLSDVACCKKIGVIPIVGMGGIGKTTLAQAIYNDGNVTKHFELKAWVCVSEEFDVHRVTKAILEEVTSETCNVKELSLLQVKLKERLTGKKFLIVLDDVWCEKSADLSVMCLPFKHGAQGSKIIVTTRIENVASIMGTVQIQRLQELPDKASWELFANEAYSSILGDFTEDQDLKRIGEEIVNKCKGLPLALKTLGGLLRSTLDVGEWKKILDSDFWDLREDESDIMPALKLSYHYLPSQLKRCFAYCSIFPKDYEFKKEELILLWMAENLLEHPNNKKRRIEDVGDDYFRGLVSRSFFQLSSTTKSVFVMHDLIHDLAKFVSAKYCSHLEDGTIGEMNVKKLRHLAYRATREDPYGRFSNTLQATNLRTFLCLTPHVWNMISSKLLGDLVMKLKCLRVLSLSGYLYVLPDSIGELRHLRYLDLSHTEISELPESICKLFNLQTLKLKSCSMLKRLPKDMFRLINMRFLDIRDCSSLAEMPTRFSEMKNLQTLSTFIVGKDNGSKIGELRELSNLRGELIIEKLENVIAQDQADITVMKHLETLILGWSYDNNDDPEKARDVLDMLSPNGTLKNLHIYGNPGKGFPHWLGSNYLVNIVSISLISCRNCLSLPPLGQLMSLRSLQISSFDALVTVGPEFYGIGQWVQPFSSLETLKFDRLPSWERWSDNSATFAVLKQLEISHCQKLTGDLPCFFPSLTKLEISYCEKLASKLPRMPHVLEIVVSGCENIMHVESFTAELCRFESCQCISLASCSSPISIPIGCLPNKLKELFIQNCSKLEFQFDRPHKSIEVLEMTKSCDPLITLPLDYFPNLTTLSIGELENLESLSMLYGHGEDMTRLSSLCIKECPSFVSFPKDGLPAPNLTNFGIICCMKLKYLPEKMHNLLPLLKHLVISECPEIESFPEAGLPSSLYTVSISDCSKLIAERENWHFKRLQKLRHFEFGSPDSSMKSFPEEGLLPSTITNLRIEDFPCLKYLDQNELRQFTSLEHLYLLGLPELQTLPGQVLPKTLKSLYVRKCKELRTISEGLPNSLEVLDISECIKLQNMTQKELPVFLKKLKISNCPELKIMPEKALPPSVQKLIISRCPLLAKKCRRDEGEYWNKISHIYYIQIDKQVIS